jgi:hypothetical protein
MDQLLETNGSARPSLFQSATRTAQAASRICGDSVALFMRSLLLALLWAWLWDTMAPVIFQGLGSWSYLLFLSWCVLKIHMAWSGYRAFPLIVQTELTASVLLVLYYGTRMRSLRRVLAMLFEMRGAPLEYFLPDISFDGYPVAAVLEQLAFPETLALMEHRFRQQFCFNDTFVHEISPMMNLNADVPARMQPITGGGCVNRWTPVPEHHTWNGVRNQVLAESYVVDKFLRALVQLGFNCLVMELSFLLCWGHN